MRLPLTSNCLDILHNQEKARFKLKKIILTWKPGKRAEKSGYLVVKRLKKVRVSKWRQWIAIFNSVMTRTSLEYERFLHSSMTPFSVFWTFLRCITNKKICLFLALRVISWRFQNNWFSMTKLKFSSNRLVVRHFSFACKTLYTQFFWARNRIERFVCSLLWSLPMIVKWSKGQQLTQNSAASMSKWMVWKKKKTNSIACLTPIFKNTTSRRSINDFILRAGRRRRNRVDLGL